MLRYEAPLVEGYQVGQDSSTGIKGACVDSEEDTQYKLISCTDGLKDGLLEGCVVIFSDCVEDGTLKTSTGRSFTILGE